MTPPEDLPDDIAALQAALIAERERAARAEAELAVARAKASDDAALIAHQRLQIEKLRRQLYGPRSELSELWKFDYPASPNQSLTGAGPSHC